MYTNMSDGPISSLKCSQKLTEIRRLATIRLTISQLYKIKKNILNMIHTPNRH